MTTSPDTTDEIYESIEESLRDKSRKLTNFTRRSFNYIFTRAFANQLRELEIKNLASELSGYIEYAGGPITEEDLRRLGVSQSVSATEVNEYMDDEDLDNMVSLIGVERDSGQRATGFIDIQTLPSSRTIIDPDLTFSPLSDSSDSDLSFSIDSDEPIIISEGTSVGVDIPVIADDVGEEYNIPSEQLQIINSPPIDVTGIESSTAMSGGRGEELNDELRERAQTSLTDTPDGGTVRGIKSNIYNNVEGVGREDIGVTELYDGRKFGEGHPLVEITVDGGSELELQQLIEDGRSIAIEHTLFDPEIKFLSFDIEVIGSGVDTRFVEDEIEDFILEDLNVNDDFYKNEIIRKVMNTDDDIINIDSLDISISSIENKRFIYNTDQTEYILPQVHDGNTISVYTLTKDIITDNNGNITSVNVTTNIFEQGVDYIIKDETGDGRPETIVWQDVSEPDLGEIFFVDYSVSDDIQQQRDEQKTYHTQQSDTFTMDSDRMEYNLSRVPRNASISISDASESYTQGTDYQVVNRRIEIAKEDSFEFNPNRESYTLSRSAIQSSTKISTESNTFVEGSGEDYVVEDRDGDGLEETIVWNDSSGPNGGTEFTVTYDVDNGIEQTVEWIDSTDSSLPTTGEEFTATYEVSVYQLDKEITSETQESIYVRTIDSTDSVTEYTLSQDYELVDYTADDENDSLKWIGSSLGDGKEFFVSYLSQGNVETTEKSKIDVDQITVTET